MCAYPLAFCPAKSGKMEKEEPQRLRIAAAQKLLVEQNGDLSSLWTNSNPKGTP